jgi:hypothetical protein
MGNCWGAILKFRVVLVLVALGLCHPALGQEVSAALLLPEAPVEAMEPAPFTTPLQSTSMPKAPSHRRFWDRENGILFASSAAFSAADFVVTKDNLSGGGRELNPVTRFFGTSTPGLAMNFAGETAGVVGLSYVFHKTGHHKLERAVSMLNISSSAMAVSFDLAHR